MVAGAGIVAAVVALIGGVVGAWSSNDFLVLALLAAIVAAAAAWSSAAPRVTSAIPLRFEIVATLAAAVVAVLGIWRLIEALFDFDQMDEYGGIVGLATNAGLAAAGVALGWFALQRDPATSAAIRSSDRSARLAAGGLALALLGWAVMLAGYWTMRQAALSLVLVTLAALIVLLAGRGLPAVAGWVGVVVGALAGLVALDLWGQLMRLGERRLDLGLTDYLPFVAYVVGLVLIIAGGALTGMAAMPRTPASPAAPAPPAPPTPPSSAA
jgi:hypothetical protein